MIMLENKKKCNAEELFCYNECLHAEAVLRMSILKKKVMVNQKEEAITKESKKKQSVHTQNMLNVHSDNKSQRKHWNT